MPKIFVEVVNGIKVLLGVLEILKMLLLLEVVPPKIGVVVTSEVGLTPKMLVLLLARLPKAGVALPNVDVVLPKMLLPVVLLLPKMEAVELAEEELLNKLVVVLELPKSPPVDVLKILNVVVVDGALVEEPVVFAIEKEKVLMTLVLAFVVNVGDSSTFSFDGITVFSNLEGFSNKSLKVSDFVG